MIYESRVFSENELFTQNSLFIYLQIFPNYMENSILQVACRRREQNC